MQLFSEIGCRLHFVKDDMAMSKMFNIGYYDFSSDVGLNFQLNRFFSSGILNYDELMDIGPKVTSFEKRIELFSSLASKEIRSE